jgi:hypothetical protein
MIKRFIFVGGKVTLDFHIQQESFWSGSTEE